MGSGQEPIRLKQPLTAHCGSQQPNVQLPQFQEETLFAVTCWHIVECLGRCTVLQLSSMSSWAINGSTTVAVSVTTTILDDAFELCNICSNISPPW